MITLGDPRFRRPDGSASELRFMRGEKVVAIVHGDLIKNIKVRTAMTGTAFVSVLLEAALTAGLAVLPDDTLLAVWVGVGARQQRLCVCQIDYWNHDSDEAKDVITIEGRGVLASIIDRACRTTKSGDLGDVIADLCGGDVPLRITGLSGRNVDVCINAPSLYGALRLMAVSMGFVIHEDSVTPRVDIVSVEHAADELRRRPPVVIRKSDMKSATAKRGIPVRQRKDGGD